jgi:hypothetical protein
LSTHLRLGFPSGLFPSCLTTNILNAFIFSFVLYNQPISSSLTWLFFLARSASYEAPHYAVFSSLPSLHLSSVQIFFSAPCSRTPSVCVPPLISEIKFHIRTKLQAELRFCIF